MPQPLTFGIEFEFAFAVIPLYFNPPASESTDGHPRALRSNLPPASTAELLEEAYTAINALLNTHGARTVLSPLDRGTTRMSLRSHDSIRWHLISDPSIRGPNRDYHWLQIELISPILKLTPDGIAEAMEVASLIQKKFRVSTNSSTGLHVHIGDSLLGFPLEETQRIMGFFYVFDTLLAPIHPPSRQNAEYARNIRDACMLQFSNRWSVEEGLDAIMSTKTIEELEFGFGGRRPAVNLKNLRKGMDASKKTVEFRQHAGTLDDKRVQAWIQTVGGIVDWCRRATDKDYHEVVNESAQEMDDKQPLSYPSIHALLKAVGLSAPANFYRKRLAKTNGKEREGELAPDNLPLSDEYVVDSSSSDDGDSSSDEGVFSPRND